MIIVGAGPAGISAAIFLQRVGLEPVLIEKGEIGGLLRSANWVENYPGFPDGIAGQDLVALFKRHLKSVGAKITGAEVHSVKRARWGFNVSTSAGERHSRAVILATGTRPEKVTLEGAKELAGRYLFSELHELPSAVKGKRVIIIGGGDAAFDYALALWERRAHILLVSRSEPRCLSILRGRAEGAGIEILIGAAPREVRPLRNGVKVICDFGSSSLELDGDLVLMACGRVPNIEVLGASLRHAMASSHNGLPETSVKGLYLVGDVVREKQRQTGIAVGDGIRAAMLVEEYLGGR